ncbi:MAG: hypothetical protein II875_11625 [Clostridia bacterium]|nr:hypothetical protein [Clostridia bacterium]
MSFIPDVLSFIDGRKAESAQDWALRRDEILELLAREEYGFLPEKKPVRISTLGKNNAHSGGRGIEEKLELRIEADMGPFTVPVTLLYPDTPEKHPLFLYISFSPDIYQHYFPAETVLSRGYAVAMLHYTAITSDDGDMQNGLAGLMDRADDGSGWGKISLWAWTLSRALDALLLRDDIDKANIAVIGHSRLGKTALWCGANDERIRFVCVNDSGCSGAAMERCKNPDSETAEKIYRRFPFWFCENYQKHGFDVDNMPFDQHFALAACCPRFVAVHSASLDDWADPASEMRSCLNASPVWKLYGMKGLDEGVKGSLSYFLREGTHYLALADWTAYMDFIEAHKA